MGYKISITHASLLRSFVPSSLPHPSIIGVERDRTRCANISIEVDANKPRPSAGAAAASSPAPVSNSGCGARGGDTVGGRRWQAVGEGGVGVRLTRRDGAGWGSRAEGAYSIRYTVIIFALLRKLGMLPLPVHA